MYTSKFQKCSSSLIFETVATTTAAAAVAAMAAAAAIATTQALKSIQTQDIGQLSFW